nr:MAG TPA: hypothetical protein [Caudoviricetes sp.]
MVFVRVRLPDTHKNIFYLIRPAKKIPTYVIRRHVCHCCI